MIPSLVNRLAAFLGIVKSGCGLGRRFTLLWNAIGVAGMCRTTQLPTKKAAFPGHEAKRPKNRRGKTLHYPRAIRYRGRFVNGVKLIGDG